MKVLFVWDADYPWDIRVEKICNALINAGWEVHLVCRNRSRMAVEEFYKGIYLHRIPSLPKGFSFLNDIFTFPFFLSPIWLIRIYLVAKQQNVKLIVVRDLPMALSAIFVGKIKKIPVVLDMAECYPEFIRHIWKFDPFKLSNILVRNPFIVDLVEKLALRKVDHIFVMVEESKNRLISNGISENKITIVSNTPIMKRFQKARASFPGIIEQNKGKLIMLYVGFLDYSRGLGFVLESLRQFVKHDNKIFLVLLGKGNAERYLKEMVSRFKLEKYVGFEGWVDNKIVPEYITSADICLVPHHKCGHWNNTIPNKLFDYMSTGKPVLVSDVNPMKRILNLVNCGLVFKDKDSESFVSQLFKLKDSDLRRKLGQNGVEAVQKHYNWEIDSARMLNSIEKILTNSIRKKV